MSSFNEYAWPPSEGNNDGPSSLPNPVSPGATSRQATSRREPRNTSNWTDASPLHHNEGTSYFQQGRVSPALSRRMQNAQNTLASTSHQRPTSSASHRYSRSHRRSGSVSSAQQRRRDAAFSEEEEEEDEYRSAHDGRRASIASADDTSSSDDEEAAERAKTADSVSETGSLDPVTLCEHSIPSVPPELMTYIPQEGTSIINQRKASFRFTHLETRSLQEVQDGHSRRRTRTSF